MQDNSRDKKKTLVVSVLAFLFIGGGVFLFFVIQGSNELTGAGKSNFHYGEAAREGVSSFFKSIGVIPDEEGNISKYKEEVLEAREALAAAQGDVSDWMASNNTPGSAASGSPSRAGAGVVPKMSGSGGSSAGGSGGGTKSSGGSSRFGEGSSGGSVNVSAKSQGGDSGLAGKGSLGALKNARAMLGDGLRSNSAITARSKWGQSFGVGAAGGGSGGGQAYGKTGLVKLDHIKSGEIASLKTTEVPAAGAFERDKAAEGKDPTLNAAKDKAKADAEAEAKKAAIQAAVDAAAKSMESKPKPETAPVSNADTPPQAVIDGAKSLIIKAPEGQPGEVKGASFYDSSIAYAKNPDGTFTATYNSIYTPPGGQPISIPNKVNFSADGKPKF